MAARSATATGTAMSEDVTQTIFAMKRIRDMCDKSGAATYPHALDKHMAHWERQGLVERHFMGDAKRVAIITAAGRKLAEIE